MTSADRRNKNRVSSMMHGRTSRHQWRDDAARPAGMYASRPKVSPGFPVRRCGDAGTVSAMGYETAKSVDADSFGDSKDGYSPMTVARIIAAARSPRLRTAR